MAKEIEEETGYRAGTIERVMSLYTSPGIIDEVLHLFVARNLVPFPHSREEGEHITVEAYSLDECLRMIGSGEISDAKTIVGILWYHLECDQNFSS